MDLSRTHAGTGPGGPVPVDGVSPRAAAIGGLWAAAFGVEHVDADRSFASLGGTAREAAAIAAGMKALFGVTVPDGILDAASTPASLARAFFSGEGYRR